MKLAFIHIPKCGGTAFESYLLSSLARRQLRARCFTGLSASGSPETFREYVDSSESSPLLFGHLHLSDYRAAMQAPFFLTLLRDPVARTISQYKSWHDRRNFTPEHAAYKVGNDATHEALSFAQNATLEEFVYSDSPYIQRNALGNLQTRFLCSDPGAGDAQRLASAKQNLACVNFLGVLEHFERSIEHLRQIFPELPAYEVPAERENRSRVQVDPPNACVIHKIKEQTQLDQELYAHALAIFEERLASVPPAQYEISSALKPLADASSSSPISVQPTNAEIPLTGGNQLRGWFKRLIRR